MKKIISENKNLMEVLKTKLFYTTEVILVNWTINDVGTIRHLYKKETLTHTSHIIQKLTQMDNIPNKKT